MKDANIKPSQSEPSVLSSLGAPKLDDSSQQARTSLLADLLLKGAKSPESQDLSKTAAPKEQKGKKANGELNAQILEIGDAFNNQTSESAKRAETQAANPGLGSKLTQARTESAQDFLPKLAVPENSLNALIESAKPYFGGGNSEPVKGEMGSAVNIALYRPGLSESESGRAIGKASYTISSNIESAVLLSSHVADFSTKSIDSFHSNLAAATLYDQHPALPPIMGLTDPTIVQTPAPNIRIVERPQPGFRIPGAELPTLRIPGIIDNGTPSASAGSPAERPVTRPGGSTSGSGNPAGAAAERPAARPGGATSEPGNPAGAAAERPSLRPGGAITEPGSSNGTTAERPSLRPGGSISEPVNPGADVVSKSFISSPADLNPVIHAPIFPGHDLPVDSTPNTHNLIAADFNHVGTDHFPTPVFGPLTIDGGQLPQGRTGIYEGRVPGVEVPSIIISRGYPSVIYTGPDLGLQVIRPSEQAKPNTEPRLNQPTTESKQDSSWRGNVDSQKPQANKSDDNSTRANDNRPANIPGDKHGSSPEPVSARPPASDTAPQLRSLEVVAPRQGLINAESNQRLPGSELRADSRLAIAPGSEPARAASSTVAPVRIGSSQVIDSVNRNSLLALNTSRIPDSLMQSDATISGISRVATSIGRNAGIEGPSSLAAVINLNPQQVNRVPGDAGILGKSMLPVQSALENQIFGNNKPLTVNTSQRQDQAGNIQNGAFKSAGIGMQESGQKSAMTIPVNASKIAETGIKSVPSGASNDTTSKIVETGIKSPFSTSNDTTTGKLAETGIKSLPFSTSNDTTGKLAESGIKSLASSASNDTTSKLAGISRSEAPEISARFIPENKAIAAVSPEKQSKTGQRLVPVPEQLQAQEQLEYIADSQNNDEHKSANPALVIAFLLSLAGLSRGRSSTNPIEIDEDNETEDRSDEKTDDNSNQSSPTRLLKRRTHMVDCSDTLQAIAEKYFQDSRVAWLIADLNSPTSLEHEVETRRVVELKARQPIQLPDTTEVQVFLLSLPRNFDIEKQLVTVVADTVVNDEVLKLLMGLFSMEAAGPRANELNGQGLALPELTIV